MTQLTTQQMKAALAAINPAPAQQPDEEFYISDAISDVIAGTAAGAIHAVETFGSGTVSFLDRVKTGYLFQRKVQAGLIDLSPAPEPEPEVQAVLAPPPRRARAAAH